MCGEVKAKAVKHGRTEVCLSCFSGLQHKAPRKRDHAREEAGRKTVAVKLRLTESDRDKLDAVTAWRKAYGKPDGSRSATVAWLVEKLMRDWPEVVP